MNTNPSNEVDLGGLDYADFVDICENCDHSMSMHMGIVDMGGGHLEPIGCMHKIGPLPDDICPCMNYNKDGEY